MGVSIEWIYPKTRNNLKQLRKWSKVVTAGSGHDDPQTRLAILEHSDGHQHPVNEDE